MINDRVNCMKSILLLKNTVAIDTDYVFGTA